MKLWPRIGVSVMILEGAPPNCQAVIVRRGKAPYAGYWSLPGGSVELGETLQEAARREILEETGLQIQIEQLVKFSESIIRNDDNAVESHFVLAVFQARVTGGALCAGDDADEAVWVDARAGSGLRFTPGVAEVLAPHLGPITGL